MNTKVVRIKEEEKTRETLEKNPGLLEAAEILRNGGLVAFPTETVYGLGANALDEEAARKTYTAKGRPSDNPLIVHIAEKSALEEIVEELPEETKALTDRFWPGPLTLILRKTQEYRTGRQEDWILWLCGCRMIRIALELIRRGGGYVSAPSANTRRGGRVRQQHSMWRRIWTERLI